MKAISTILMMVLMSVSSCKSQKNVNNATTTNPKQAKDFELVYVANTRGFYQKITIKNQEVSVSSDRNAKDNGASQRISDADWKELQGYFYEVQLEKLSTFKDPTQKRFYDGAAIATLKIITNGKEFQTKDFDNGFPPVEIEKLVTKITSLGTSE